MSAIGDYIHLTYEGYANGPKEGSGKPPFVKGVGAVISSHERIFNQDVNKMKSRIIQQLQEQMNKDLSLLNTFQMANKGKVDYPELNELIEDFLKDLDEELTNKWFQIDLVAAASNGLLSSAGFFAGRAKTKKTRGKDFTAYQQAVIQNVNQNIEEILISTVAEIENVLNNQGLPADKVQRNINSTKGKIQTFIKNLQNNIRTIDPSNKTAQKRIKQLFDNLSNMVLNAGDKQNADVVAIINTLLAGISMGIEGKGSYKGDMGEAITAVIAKRLAATAGLGIENVMTVGTSGRSQRGILTSNFTKDVNWNEILGEDIGKYEYGDYVLTTSGTQADKVDIEITLKNNEHASISVKNYSPKSLARGIRNESANLLMLLQNENNDDFINHFLNLSALKEYREDKNRIAAYNLIRKIVIAKLITGYNTMTSGSGDVMTTANIFAVYNAQGKTLANGTKGASVQLYDMKDVLTNIFKNDRYNNLNIPQFFYNANIKQNDYTTRITNIMKQLAVKVSYTLKEEDYAKK